MTFDEFKNISSLTGSLLPYLRSGAYAGIRSRSYGQENGSDY